MVEDDGWVSIEFEIVWFDWLVVGFDSGVDDEGLGEFVILLELCRVVDVRDIFIKGGLLMVDEEVIFLMLVCWGDDERIVMFDLLDGWIKFDEIEDGEVTIIIKEEFIFGKVCEVDVVIFVFFINVDVWFMFVVDWVKFEVLLFKIVDDSIKCWDDVEGNVLLSINVDDTIIFEEGFFIFDGIFVIVWGKVEVLFLSIVDTDGFKFEEDVEGKVLFFIIIDEIIIFIEKFCIFDDLFIIDWVKVEVLLFNIIEDVIMLSDNRGVDVILALSLIVVGDGVNVFIIFVIDKLVWVVVFFIVFDVCNEEFFLFEDDVNILLDRVRVLFGVRFICKVVDDGFCIIELVWFFVTLVCCDGNERKLFVVFFVILINVDEILFVLIVSIGFEVELVFIEFEGSIIVEVEIFCGIEDVVFFDELKFVDIDREEGDFEIFFNGLDEFNIVVGIRL